MHRTGDCDAKIEEGRYIAAHIPGAKLVELAGADHLLWTGDQDAVLREVESFIGSIGENPEVDSILATGLYITAKSTADRDLDRFHPLAIRETEWFKGRVSEAGNHAFFATFDGPIRAIRCAKAIRDSALEVGIETKAGLHTGLCEMRGDKSSGPPVEISKRLADLAAAGEVLLTNAVVDLVSGSDVSFTDRGTFNIEGVPKHFRVFSAV
jgi:hypothetical protein